MLMLEATWIQMRVTMCLHIEGVEGDNIECLINFVLDFFKGVWKGFSIFSEDNLGNICVSEVSHCRIMRKVGD